MSLPTVLQRIIQDKKDWIAAKKSAFPLSQFQPNITKSDRSFYTVLSQEEARPAFILECKKASPSKGLIRADFNLAEIANIYKHYASVISVLTDEKYFQGDFAFLPQVRQIAPQPILCKDFIIDEYQVYLARYHQADAILLMLSVLNDEQYQTLANVAHQLGMGVLTETSNEAEFERALALNAKIIGVNNRNLHNLTVNLDCVKNLVEKYRISIPADVRIISESGIYTHQQVQELSAYSQGFLIGSSLMSQANLDLAVRKIIFGENKVCGLTRPQDVQQVYELGGLYGGLIFAEGSPRQVSLRQAQELVTTAPLAFVGVFQNQDLNLIVQTAQQLSLAAVQLHGNETAEFITALRQQLPAQTQIWKAISVDVNLAEAKNALESAVQNLPISLIDRYVLDSQKGHQQGGTGEAFDWSQIPQEIKAKSLLAGGIKPDNLAQALAQGCLGVDLNSGVEERKGVKSAEKLRQAFNIIAKH